ncbi:hypothetical protein ACFXTN_031679 [Malus domestica]
MSHRSASYSAQTEQLARSGIVVASGTHTPIAKSAASTNSTTLLPPIRSVRRLHSTRRHQPLPAPLAITSSSLVA